MKFSILSTIAFVSLTSALPLEVVAPGIVSFASEPEESSFFGNLFGRLSKRGTKLSHQIKLTELDDETFTLSFGVGYPVKKYTFKLDNDASDIWIANETSITEKPYYFNGDTVKSSSEVLGSTVYQDGSYVNYTHASTQLKVGRNSVKNVPIGIGYKTSGINDLGKTSGVVGLGFPSDGEETLLDLLKEQSYTNRSAYALALFNNQKVGANVLLGGFDHGKYKGNLYTIPNTQPDNVDDGRKHFGLHIKNVQIDKSTYDINSTALVSVASSKTYLPEDVYNKISDHFRVDHSKLDLYGAPVIDIQKDGGKKITLNFSGVEIEVTGEDLASPLPEGSKKSRHLRIFGIGNSADNNDVTVLGQSFLKASYVVFDLDGDRLGLSQIDKNPGATRLIPIEDEIKYSRPAPDFEN